VRTSRGSASEAPEIPTKRSRHVQHCVSHRLDGLRSRIACLVDRQNDSRRVAIRDDQNADSFLGFAALPSIQPWIRLVRATWTVMSADHRRAVRPVVSSRRRPFQPAAITL
jgi:hypothetical protein